MKIYLDASVIVALLTDDAQQARAETFLRATLPILVVSDFASAEFSSAVSRRVRTREIAPAEAQAIFAAADAWVARFADRVETTTADVKVAEALVRRLDVTLRAPDAINIAISQRVGASLATFDAKLATSAQALGTAIAAA